jgi:hypothetical protein
MIDPNDEILEIKRRLSAQFGNDVRLIAEETRRHQIESGRKVISLPPRRVSTPTVPDLAIESSRASVENK